ncbi:centromere protein S [Scyliorhinus canicula]|uniref:centromere protein S n=1 Tax=Scyliorhinus canicula TaxID=7830 RepID=UPI0018F785FE|nr:centromere protein S [Scyliorhinus canicula]
MAAEPEAQNQTEAALSQRLRAAVHYTVGHLCQEVGEDKKIKFSKQTIAAIAETTFRQCENFATDLEIFAKHGKRTTVNTDDAKLLARRSKALLNFITEKCNELATNNAEQKEKRALTTGKGKKKSDDRLESAVTESDDVTVE